MKEKERQKAESRERILEAAARLFRSQGFTATGIDELMAEAGLTAGAFYAHFDSKQDLFDSTLEHLLKSSAGFIAAGRGREGGIALVQDMLARYASEAHRDQPELGCAVPAIASEIARHSRRGKEIIGDYMERWVELFARNLHGSAEERRARALQLVAQAVGAVLIARMVPESLSSELLRAARSLGPGA